MKPDNDGSYTDFQAHYETCPRCRRDWKCEVGVEAKRRDERRTDGVEVRL